MYYCGFSALRLVQKQVQLVWPLPTLMVANK